MGDTKTSSEEKKKSLQQRGRGVRHAYLGFKKSQKEKSPKTDSTHRGGGGGRGKGPKRDRRDKGREGEEVPYNPVGGERKGEFYIESHMLGKVKRKETIISTGGGPKTHFEEKGKKRFRKFSNGKIKEKGVGRWYLEKDQEFFPQSPLGHSKKERGKGESQRQIGLRHSKKDREKKNRLFIHKPCFQEGGHSATGNHTFAKGRKHSH